MQRTSLLCFRPVRLAVLAACAGASVLTACTGRANTRGAYGFAKAELREADLAGSFSGGSSAPAKRLGDSEQAAVSGDPVLGSRVVLPRSVSRVGAASGQPDPAAVGRMMVYTAWLTMVVDEAQAALTETEALAGELGGYVEQIQGAVISVRIPVERYAEAVARVEALGQVAERRQQAEDKTDEFVDLEARLKNAQVVRGRLAELLAKAENVEAALKVEIELKRIGEEIERLTAQLETLSKRIALSTITVTFQTVARQERPATLGRLPFEWLRELRPSNLLQN